MVQNTLSHIWALHSTMKFGYFEARRLQFESKQLDFGTYQNYACQTQNNPARQTLQSQQAMASPILREVLSWNGRSWM